MGSTPRQLPRGPALAQPACDPAGSDPRRLPVVPAGGLTVLRRVYIHETEVGLLDRRGRSQRLLAPGVHWLRGLGLSVTRVDSRRRLTVRALHEVESYEHELHVAVQLALRSVIGESTAGPSSSSASTAAAA